MTEVEIYSWNVDADGPLTAVAMRARLEKLGYRVTEYVYEPGTTFGDHTHAVDKIDAVLSGRFEMGMYGKKVVLCAGDYVVVPKNVVHNARVLGDEAVVSLDASKRS